LGTSAAGPIATCPVSCANVGTWRHLPTFGDRFTVTLVTLVGASAMAGAIGAGGLGDLAIRYGCQRFETTVMVAVAIVLIILVCGIQWTGDRLVARLDHRA
jgi:D-methionine transport system permease protein